MSILDFGGIAHAVTQVGFGAMPGIGKRRIWLAVALLAGLACLAGGAQYVRWSSWNTDQFRAAQAAFNERDFQQADEHVQQCLAYGTRDANIHVLGVRVARRLANWNEAANRLQLAERKLGSRPALDLERRLLAISQGDVQELDILLAQYAANQELQEASEVLEVCLDARLKALLPAYLGGATFPGESAAAQVEQTRQVIQSWLANHTDVADQARGLIWSAQANVFAHDTARAITDIRRAVELDPQNSEARLHLALILSPTQPAEAAAQLRELHRKQRADGRALISLASVLRRLGELEEARDLLDELLSKNPNDAAALLERGRIAQDLNQLEDAERFLRQAYRIEPRPDVSRALVNCLRLSGKTDEAKRLQASGAAGREQTGGP